VLLIQKLGALEVKIRALFFCHEESFVGCSQLATAKPAFAQLLNEANVLKRKA
jgi:hypothetical protein